jgi:hypothetical protein
MIWVRLEEGGTRMEEELWRTRLYWCGQCVRCGKEVVIKYKLADMEMKVNGKWTSFRIADYLRKNHLCADCYWKG